MPRESRISWNALQRSKLNSAVRKYNNAVRKAAKNSPLGVELLPAEVSYKELKGEITSRRALKNTINRLTRATRPHAMEFAQQADGSIVTKYELHEYNILKSMRERAKSMKAKRLGITQPPPGRIGNLQQAKLMPGTAKAGTLSSMSLKRFIRYQERELNMSSVDKARRYFANYQKALYEVFGGFGQYDDALEWLSDTIIKLAGEDFDALEQAIENGPDIEFIYEPQQRDYKLRLLIDYWGSLYED